MNLIYCVLSPSGKQYFGLTSNFKQRKKRHEDDARHGVTTKICAAIRKYGDRLVWQIHTDHLTLADAKELEDDLICGFDTIRFGYNGTRGGNVPPSRLGATHSAEARAKIGQAQRKGLGAKRGRKCGTSMVPSHGAVSRYILHKCRCDLCKQAKAAVQARWRVKSAAKNLNR